MQPAQRGAAGGASARPAATPAPKGAASQQKRPTAAGKPKFTMPKRKKSKAAQAAGTTGGAPVMQGLASRLGIPLATGGGTKHTFTMPGTGRSSKKGKGSAKSAAKKVAVATPTPAAAAGERAASRSSLPRVIAAVLIAAVIVVGLGAAVLVNSGFFSVTNVVVNGSEHVPQQTVQQMVDIPEGATLLNVSDDVISDQIKQNPWVSGVKIERQFPHTLVITPQERSVAAIAYIVADDIAWAIGDDSCWIAPLSLSVGDGTGTVLPDDAGSAASDGTAAVDGADGTDTAGQYGADVDSGTAGTGDSADGADASTGDGADDATDGAEPTDSSGVDAAVQLARDLGAVLLTDVGTDVSPVSGQEVSSETVEAGLRYALGFSDEFLAQIKDISIPSVEAISANLVSGVEVSLGKPEDIQEKEQVIRTLLDTQKGVTYINVRVADAYSFRSAPTE